MGCEAVCIGGRGVCVCVCRAYSSIYNIMYEIMLEVMWPKHVESTL